MDEIIKIGNHEISEKIYNGKRVVTFKDIDLVHERPEGTAGRNFRENKERFIEGEDYFYLSGEDLRAFKQATNFVGSQIKDIILITQQGYLMLVKSLTDDLAWKVQRELVNLYFQKQKQMSYMEMLELQFLATREIEQKVDVVYQDLQNFKQDMPILGIEESKITTAVRQRGVYCLGGKDTRAYINKSLRGKVYSDIYGQLKREFGVASYKAIKRSQCELAIDIVKKYEMPLILAEQVNEENSKMFIA